MADPLLALRDEEQIHYVIVLVHLWGHTHLCTHPRVIPIRRISNSAQFRKQKRNSENIFLSPPDTKCLEFRNCVIQRHWLKTPNLFELRGDDDIVFTLLFGHTHISHPSVIRIVIVFSWFLFIVQFSCHVSLWDVYFVGIKNVVGPFVLFCAKCPNLPVLGYAGSTVHTRTLPFYQQIWIFLHQFSSCQSTQLSWLRENCDLWRRDVSTLFFFSDYVFFVFCMCLRLEPVCQYPKPLRSRLRTLVNSQFPFPHCHGVWVLSVKASIWPGNFHLGALWQWPM